MRNSDIQYYRNLMSGHRSSLAAAGRVGSIIWSFRPSPVLSAGLWPDVVQPEKMSIGQVQQLKSVIQASAPSIGAIEFTVLGQPRFATCFRVSNDPHRVITARHVVKALLETNAQLSHRPDAVAQPELFGPAYRSAQVRFEEQPRHDQPGAIWAEEVITIEAVEWAHDEWDLALLRLGTGSDRPPLPLDDSVLADDPDNWICTIGYPAEAPANMGGGFEHVFDLPLGRKRASPGLVTGFSAGPGAGIMRHDATTLGGNSGGPIISLQTGKVVGLHFRGGSGPAIQNSALIFSRAMQEDALRGRLTDDPVLSARPPDTWGRRRPGLTVGVPLDLARSDGLEYAELSVPSMAQGNGVLPDRFDRRDRFYQPPLLPADVALPPQPPLPGEVGEQRDPYSCTGFALAAAINRLLRQRPRNRHTPAPRVSPTMLYALATQHDEYVDDQPGGSSLRGAMKGFFNFGVCSWDTAPYERFDPDWHLTIDAAKEARHTTLGAYYRLRPILPDYHLALKESGAIIVSAHTHAGWKKPNGRRMHRIPYRVDRLGAHAFIIVGYDADGFIIQNSWGDDWADWKGMRGLAHWSYEDWAENLIDAWVLRLALPTPKAFDLQVRNDPGGAEPPQRVPVGYARLRDVRQSMLVGHSVHIERDGIRGDGRLGLGPAGIRETALYLAGDKGRQKYEAIALIFHDAATSADLVARLAGHMIQPLKVNGIYPLHVHYGADEMRSLLVRMLDEADQARQRSRAPGENLTGFLQRRAAMVAGPLLSGWIEGLSRAVEPGGGLWQALASVGLEAGTSEGSDGAPRRLHMIGIGTGAATVDMLIPKLGDMGFGQPDSVSIVAGWGLPGRQAPAAGRVKVWQLDSGAAADVAIPGFDGDWSDLLALLGGSSDLRPRRDKGRQYGRDLASAITDTTLLNDILRNVLDRSPAPTRRFS